MAQIHKQIRSWQGASVSTYRVVFRRLEEGRCGCNLHLSFAQDSWLDLDAIHEGLEAAVERARMEAPIHEALAGGAGFWGEGRH